MTSPIGTRVHIIGGTNAGKSTLGARLGQILDVPHVELDALNWEPDWTSLAEVDPERLTARIQQATAGHGWVVDGDYSRFTRPLLWPRVETVIVLDLPRLLAVRRVLTRSWRRWRSKQLLWGTNRENFWEHFLLWRRADSLLWWAWTQHGRKRERCLQEMIDPQWRHIRFVRLLTEAEVNRFVALVEQAVAGAAPPP